MGARRELVEACRNHRFSCSVNSWLQRAPHVYVVAQGQGAQRESDGLIGDRGGMDNGMSWVREEKHGKGQVDG